MQSFFNISALRETANLWRFKLDSSNNNPENPDDAPFIFITIDQKDQEKKTIELKYELNEIVERIQQ